MSILELPGEDFLRALGRAAKTDVRAYLHGGSSSLPAAEAVIAVPGRSEPAVGPTGP